jgi:sensor histidine kinase regulating citrate/malate metabolism
LAAHYVWPFRKFIPAFISQPDILVSIIGNLLDNAIYESAQHDNKWIAINISENSNWYVFEIENPGIIKPEIQDKIFEKGFTTKGKDGSGMGLAIVCDLISKFNGKIDFEIKEDSVNPSVKFTVSLPRLLDSDERRLAG